MRLRDMLALINEILPKIDSIKLNTSQRSNSNVYVYRISNIGTAYESFKKLKIIDVFKADIDELFNHHDYLITNQAEISISQEAYNDIAQRITHLKTKCQRVIDILEQIVQSQDEKTISFKLYEFEDFSEYVDFCNDLNKKILAPLNRLNIKVSLGELESGTNWLSIIIGVSFGVALLTAIIRQAFDILINDYERYKVADTLMKSLEMEKEFVDAYNKKILEKKDKEKNDKVDQIVKEIEENPEFSKMDDGELSEFKNSVKLSMDLMGKHIDRGLMVYQALDIAENERYELPDFMKLITAKKPQQLIAESKEDKKEDKNDDEESDKYELI